MEAFWSLNCFHSLINCLDLIIPLEGCKCPEDQLRNYRRLTMQLKSSTTNNSPPDCKMSRKELPRIMEEYYECHSTCGSMADQFGHGCEVTVTIVSPIFRILLLCLIKVVQDGAEVIILIENAKVKILPI